MKGVVNTNRIRIGAAALLTLFMVYYATIAFYTHVHWVDGVMLVHAHPFSNQHTHASGQAFALHLLSDFNALSADDDSSARPDLFVFYSLLYNPDTFHVIAQHTACISLRAPPCFFSI